MKPHFPNQPQRIKNPAYRPAVERLGRALENTSPPDNSEKMELLGLCLFGELWRPAKPTNAEGATE